MLIGRKAERKELIEAYNSEYSEFVAITGRRRVGKTFLVRETFDYKFAFQHSGLANQNTASQLRAFHKSLVGCGLTCSTVPSGWFEAFTMLGRLLDSKPAGKKVVLIDELPWMDAPNSNFVSAVENFWNSFASARKDILLIVCGSATSWIIKKVFRNHGGLHNRVTHRLHLAPFTLHECEEYVQYLQLNYSRYNIVELYMAMGGVPFYWSMLRRGESVAQNINRLFFNPNGALRHEYDNLYASLFKNPDPYIAVIEALCSRKTGMTRADIAEHCKLANNGKLTKILDELETCGFIRHFSMRGSTRRVGVFQLIDCYTLFYSKFLNKKSGMDENYWTNNIQPSSVTSWEGLAFEKVCYLHYRQIKMGLGIYGVEANSFAWNVGPDDVYGAGAQIDMVIERADKVVNLCEMKFATSEFVVDKTIEQNLRHKEYRYRQTAKKNISVFMTLITPFGLNPNKYSSVFQNMITLNDLFLP